MFHKRILFLFQRTITYFFRLSVYLYLIFSAFLPSILLLTWVYVFYDISCFLFVSAYINLLSKVFRGLFWKFSIVFQLLLESNTGKELLHLVICVKEITDSCSTDIKSCERTDYKMLIHNTGLIWSVQARPRASPWFNFTRRDSDACFSCGTYTGHGFLNVSVCLSPTVWVDPNCMAFSNSIATHTRARGIHFYIAPHVLVFLTVFRRALISIVSRMCFCSCSAYPCGAYVSTVEFSFSCVFIFPLDIYILLQYYVDIYLFSIICHSNSEIL